MSEQQNCKHEYVEMRVHRRGSSYPPPRAYECKKCGRTRYVAQYTPKPQVFTGEYLDRVKKFNLNEQ
jgi:hypothetical protein